MLFTMPCCQKLDDALTQGETRMFELVGEPQSVLMLATGYFAEEHEGQMARVWIHEPVRFCPFCGTHLQSEEAIEEWRHRNTEA